jgi:tetratricopeptide (TPR) repeat protein
MRATSPQMTRARSRRRMTPLALACALGLALAHAPEAGAGPSDTDRVVDQARRGVQRRPSDATALFRLGDAYIRKARETGDVDYFVRAEEALRRSLALAPRHAGALRHLAYVRYSVHDFQEAARLATSAVEIDSGDGHAYGILGDAALETGDDERAEAAYRRMLERESDLHAWARLAGLRSVRGDPAGAIEMLARAIEEGQRSGRPPETVAWAQWQLGSEHFTVGEIAAAEARYRESLSTYPGYHRALAGLAQVRAAQQRYQEAVELYQKALAVVPLPDYAAVLGDVYATMGDAGAARRQYDLVEYIGRLSTLSRTLYNRELAYFYADHDRHLDRVLELARRELEVRHDVYAYDVLAWALYKTGRLSEAREAIEHAMERGTRDPRLFFHAGLIHLGLGATDTGRAYLERALATNPHFHPLHADLARRLLRR